MRVIAGIAKGRRLKSVPGGATRPTADRVRQTIFDILGDVAGAGVLDLFAGTGALGIEALSRGAAHATFVESAPAAAAVVKANVDATGFAASARVLRRDAERLLASSPPAGEGFDLVFLDPPYERGLAFVSRILSMLVQGGWVRAGGRVVAEAAAGAVEIPAGLHHVRVRPFGGTHVTIVARDDVEEGRATSSRDAGRGPREPHEPGFRDDST